MRREKLNHAHDSKTNVITSCHVLSMKSKRGIKAAGVKKSKAASTGYAVIWFLALKLRTAIIWGFQLLSPDIQDPLGNVAYL